MNKADENALTEYWHRETRYVNDKVDEAFKDAQDHAYALGMKRGKEEMLDYAKRLVAARDAEDQREWTAIIKTIEGEDSDEAEKLNDLLSAIDRALDPSRHKGALL